MRVFHFLTSKLITCFIDGFTSKRKSQSIAYLFNGSEHIYWILDLENEVHSIYCRLCGQATFKNARVTPGSGRPGLGDRGSSFFGATPARHSNACNARRGYLQSPEVHPSKRYSGFMQLNLILPPFQNKSYVLENPWATPWA
jgi:hypothetical protein